MYEVALYYRAGSADDDELILDKAGNFGLTLDQSRIEQTILQTKTGGKPFRVFVGERPEQVTEFAKEALDELLAEAIAVRRID